MRSWNSLGMEKICRVSGKAFVVTEQDLDFLSRLSPNLGGQKIPLPVPQLCPDERKRRRLAFRNERNLYHRKCDFTGRSIISLYSPDKPYKVYAKDVWWSDQWDARSYGRDVDFSRPFFEQFAELKLETPQVALITSPDADENNCPYINFAGNSKNCHMTFDSDFNEDSYFSNVLKHSKDCCDCSYVRSSELCYQCIDCSNCYDLHYSQNCTNCSSSYFLHGCIGCSNCFMCTNLSQKQYYIENQPYNKEDYFSKIREYQLSSRSSINSLSVKFEEFHSKYPKKNCQILKVENCKGNYILNCKNSHHCFNISECEDLLYCDSLYNAKDCLDVSSFGENIECVYNSGTIGINCFNIFMSFVAVLNCSDLIYCDNCRQSEHCFGCSSLQRNKYCILNKQYSKDEYEKLSARVANHMRETGEWGEYFPIALSAFGYNETIAAHYFPLSKQQALEFGANWSEYEQDPPNVEILPGRELPDEMQDVGEEILNNAVSCVESGKPFRINQQELRFYQRKNIPVPNLHPDQRHERRMSRRNPQRLWQRNCMKTGEPIDSGYPPDSSEIVYCESAYLDALV